MWVLVFPSEGRPGNPGSGLAILMMLLSFRAAICASFSSTDTSDSNSLLNRSTDMASWSRELNPSV